VTFTVTSVSDFDRFLVAKPETYPLCIREQSVVFKIYRQKAATTTSDYSFAVT
jgi:hypothetical protein